MSHQNEKEESKIDNQQINSFLSADEEQSEQNQNEIHKKSPIKSQDIQNQEGFQFTNEELKKVQQKGLLKQQKENKLSIQKDDKVEGARNTRQQIVQQKQDDKPNSNRKESEDGSMDAQDTDERKSEQQKSPLQKVFQINSQNIVFHAFMERIGMIQNKFLQYIAKTNPLLKSHQAVLHNVMLQIQRRKKYKMIPSYILRQYFEQIIALEKQMHEQCHKIKQKQKGTLSIININQTMKSGLQELMAIRIDIGDQCLSYAQFIKEQIIKRVIKVFGDYDKRMNQAMSKLEGAKKTYNKREADFRKKIEKVNKVYGKAKQGISQEEDVYIEMTKFIQSQQEMQGALKDWGVGVLECRKVLVTEEQLLFEQLQRIMNDYKSHTKTIKYGSKNNNPFDKVLKVIEVVDQNSLQKLCVLTDIDFIRFVMELNEKEQLRNQIFQNFFSLKYFNSKSGDIQKLLKATVIKEFLLERPKQELIQTISGNIVHLNSANRQYKDRFIFKNLRAEIIGKGIVEINQKCKGIIFDSNRAVTFIFKDSDIAQQFMMLFKSDINQEQSQQMQLQR